MRLRKVIGWSIVGLLAVVGLSLGGCLLDRGDAIAAPPTGSLPAYGVIAANEAAAVLASVGQQDDFVLLDIRTAAEVESGHIPGAATLDFYSESFQSELASLDRDHAYLIYCRTGNRTGQTRALMADLGFSHVYDLGGGITQWVAQGYPTCSGSLDADHVCASMSSTI